MGRQDKSGHQRYTPGKTSTQSQKPDTASAIISLTETHPGWTRPTPDANMSKLPGLKSRLCSRIHTTKFLLTEMTTPVQSPPQEIIYEGYIKRINELTLEANTDLLDIKADYENDIEATELENFKASLYNIERKTSAAYTDLCTWKASNTRPPFANNECSEPANHTNLASPEVSPSSGHSTSLNQDKVD